jgi:uncharacterized protein (DUF1501 family)
MQRLLWRVEGGMRGLNATRIQSFPQFEAKRLRYSIEFMPPPDPLLANGAFGLAGRRDATQSPPRPRRFA